MKTTDYKVNYTTLKKAIRKSTMQGKGIDFRFDFEKLNENVAECGLTAIPNDIRSRRVNPEDVAYLGEFFKATDLQWIDQYKHMSSLIFIKTDSIDEKAAELIEDMKKPQIDYPDIDKVETLTKLLALYPCYTASVISYKSSDPKRYGLLCTEIICKANMITIQDDNNKYHTPSNNTAEEKDLDDAVVK